MLLTRCVDYGIRGILYVARQQNDKTVLLNDIAEAEKIPKSFLAKIMQTLAKANILKSSRGLNGGFSLAKPPEEIDLRQVVEVLNGPISMVECLETGGGCEFFNGCNIHPVWSRIQGLLIKELEQVTIDQFLENGLASRKCTELRQTEAMEAAAL